MRFPDGGLDGVFLRRANRFRAEVRAGRSIRAVHVPHSGRLGELLFEGNAVRIFPAANRFRATAYDLTLARRPDGRGWACIDARVPNRLVREALRSGRLPGFEGYTAVRPEHPVPGGRVDFCLKGEGLPDCLVEVKCVTLVVGSAALFPDAPTARGTGHLRHLIDHVRGGGRGAVWFVVARSDAAGFAPNRANDPDFARALREARGAGVAVRAVRCRTGARSIRLLDEIPVAPA